jgi:hypothetical protein
MMHAAFVVVAVLFYVKLLWNVSASCILMRMPVKADGSSQRISLMRFVELALLVIAMIVSLARGASAWPWGPGWVVVIGIASIAASYLLMFFVGVIAGGIALVIRRRHVSRKLGSDVQHSQRAVCAAQGTSWVCSPAHLKVGVALNVKTSLVPVNGLRRPPEGDITGWYIWAGEDLSSDPDFFVPLCVAHLPDWRPEILKFLGLPPGWRFLTDGSYEDVWEDPSLLEPET